LRLINDSFDLNDRDEQAEADAMLTECNHDNLKDIALSAVEEELSWIAALRFSRTTRIEGYISPTQRLKRSADDYTDEGKELQVQVVKERLTKAWLLNQLANGYYMSSGAFITEEVKKAARIKLHTIGAVYSDGYAVPLIAM
jgi:hypothetical protein